MGKPPGYDFGMSEESRTVSEYSYIQEGQGPSQEIEDFKNEVIENYSQTQTFPFQFPQQDDKEFSDHEMQFDHIPDAQIPD